MLNDSFVQLQCSVISSYNLKVNNFCKIFAGNHLLRGSGAFLLLRASHSPDQSTVSTCWGTLWSGGAVWQPWSSSSVLLFVFHAGIADGLQEKLTQVVDSCRFLLCLYARLLPICVLLCTRFPYKDNLCLCLMRLWENYGNRTTKLLCWNCLKFRKTWSL